MKFNRKRYMKVYNKAYRSKEKERVYRLHKGYRLRIKKKVLGGLGGQCACCGEKELVFLTLDHINGGGYKERMKTSHSTTTIYNQVVREHYDKTKYRVLCWNCNAAVGLFGKCPHAV